MIAFLHDRAAREAARATLERRCAADPACGCAWLSQALVSAEAADDRRRGLTLARSSCDAGALSGCDTLYLTEGFCLSGIDEPGCDELRRLGRVPPRAAPLERLFGCRRTVTNLGPSVDVCIARDRISVRDSSGAWDQWPLTRWTRDDRRDAVVWVAEGPSRIWYISPRAGVPTGEHRVFAEIADVSGLVHMALGARRDADLERTLAGMPTAESVCRQVERCEYALKEQRHPARGEEGHEVSRLAPTLLGCHEHWRQLVADFTRPITGVALPSACGTMHRSTGENAWAATVEPPYALPR
ncbi:hypothetical protein SAMN02745121_07454 [Nannocystis exedens]|uniref:Uncharacterized protein n=1 Tax=Nannocystis exedens TaxID=54 RepID=A0A1I2GSE3_9BACT|nr:hypothetical protein [Nannocystis exedens]PCC68757.1 hypothetical protein NAEX_01774 [Nannocystis exedens]SFF19747.1 hypothetical protein SAMN02745121_07454 [Nannocystis exedens]